MLKALLSIIFAASVPALAGQSAAPPTQKRVILISIDGLSPALIRQVDPPTIKALSQSGIYFDSAQSVFPPKTIPAHASMLTGVEPVQHGSIRNSMIAPAKVRIRTIFDQAHDKGLKTAFVGSKGKLDAIAALNPRSSIDRLMGGGPRKNFAPETTSNAKKTIREDRPDLLFIHYADVDDAGHNKGGWLGPNQVKALQNVDRGIGEILALLKELNLSESTTMIITADHGGHGAQHGEDHGGKKVDYENPAAWREGVFDPQDLTIPWIASGNCVRKKSETLAQVNVMDTAATVAHILGFELNPAQVQVKGKPVFRCEGSPIRTSGDSTAEKAPGSGAAD